MTARYYRSILVDADKTNINMDIQELLGSSRDYILNINDSFEPATDVTFIFIGEENGIYYYKSSGGVKGEDCVREEASYFKEVVSSDMSDLVLTQKEGNILFVLSPALNGYYGPIIDTLCSGLGIARKSNITKVKELVSL